MSPSPDTLSSSRRATLRLCVWRTTWLSRWSPTLRARSRIRASARFTLITRMPDDTCRKLSNSVTVASRSKRAASVMRRPSQYAGSAPSGAATSPIRASVGLSIQATTARPVSRERDSTITARSSVTVRMPLRSLYADMARSPSLLRSKKRTGRTRSLASTPCIESISTRCASRADITSLPAALSARSTQSVSTASAPPARTWTEWPAEPSSARRTSRSAQTSRPWRMPCETTAASSTRAGSGWRRRARHPMPSASATVGAWVTRAPFGGAGSGAAHCRRHASGRHPAPPRRRGCPGPAARGPAAPPTPPGRCPTSPGRA